jgi:hypothetical protein
MPARIDDAYRAKTPLRGLLPVPERVDTHGGELSVATTSSGPTGGQRATGPLGNWIPSARCSPTPRSSQVTSQQSRVPNDVLGPACGADLPDTGRRKVSPRIPIAPQVRWARGQSEAVADLDHLRARG